MVLTWCYGLFMASVFCDIITLLWLEWGCRFGDDLFSHLEHREESSLLMLGDFFNKVTEPGKDHSHNQGCLLLLETRWKYLKQLTLVDAWK